MTAILARLTSSVTLSDIISDSEVIDRQQKMDMGWVHTWVKLGWPRDVSMHMCVPFLIWRGRDTDL